MERTFLDGLLARPPVVLGRRLLVFSIGHSLILEALGHPLVTGKPMAAVDCLAAVHICTRRFFAARDWLWEIDGKSELAIEGPREFDVPLVENILRQYYRHGTEVPEIVMDAHSRDLNHPLQLSLIVGMRSLGATLESALDEGYRLAMWQCLVRNQRAVVSERTQWVIDHADEIVKQAQAEMRLRPVRQGNVNDKRRAKPTGQVG